jgi:histidine triad (HIT) family protein
MSTDADCLFCKIVAGEIPAFKLYEDADTLAFMDINPVHDGHTLVIPKAHYPTVFAIAPDAVAAVARTAARIAAAVEWTLRPDGLNLVQANGPGAGQSVAHFHVHVLPRRLGDDIKMSWTPAPGDRARIAALAERLRAQL